MLLASHLAPHAVNIPAASCAPGAMLEERKRAAMPTALYCLLSAYCLEAAALVYATAVHFGVLKDSLSSCHTAEELAR